MHLATMYGRIDNVDLLLGCGADINAQDNKKFTPLHYAANCNHAEIVQYLINAGCDHQMLNDEGLRAQEIAPEPLKSDITNYMINCLMSPRRDGETPQITPGKCILCQAECPVYTFGPCPHVQVCDTCYINNKQILKTCPICSKPLKRLMVTAEKF
ncbi:hypothetical protein TVAG_241140 [Trichomonas vaginalis G3]|uniref:Uncharacterized protein n=1 Tax=Trichomonas vaginalis (strain ATCC PRA-98 / G3) TaxID=412133 RepID=A2F6B7_TRIV3|nr:positive regulation of myosin-light-chain-phosphatase protein [Trichomonas vaginalis G3]EAX99538.1 hypothetical protein TVAG_241140 [Trichomonas vaginalis G3]KAI5532849.1 positive regulation of myosin-light-chain-phosphatase protein [Trichomonas vaginalis G3]|eukprot:XP_001312468.1 hypothetical protein [Trichomonas vaginalis G3]